MTAVAEKIAPVEAAPKKIRLNEKLLREEQHHRRHFWIDLPEGVDKDTVRHPDFWIHLARRLSRHDLVTVLAADQSWEMLLCVERIRGDGVEMSVRKVHSREPLAASRTEVEPGVYSAHRADLGGWGVFRADGDIPLTVGHNSEAAARSRYFMERPRAV